MKKIIPLILLLLIGVAIRRSQQPPQARALLTYSGVVEVTTTDLSFEISGTLKELRVREGQLVRKGELVGRLDDASAQAALGQAQARQGAAQARLDQLLAGNRPAEIAQAQARLAQAQAELEQMLNGPTQEELRQAHSAMQASQQRADVVREGSRREDIAAAKDQLEGARSSLVTSQADFKRYQRLRVEGAISDQLLEAKKNSLDQARAAFGMAEQSYLRAQRGPRPQERQAAWSDYGVLAARYRDLAKGTRPELIAKAQATVAERSQALSLMREGPRREEIQAARQQLAEARAAVDAAKVAVSKTNLYACAEGTVLTRNMEPGEAVNPGLAVVSLGDLTHPWVNIYIPEYEQPKVRLDQVGIVRADGLDKPLEGKITRIFEKAEYTPKFIQTPRERVNLVYRAKLAFDNGEGRLRPGMPADVELRP